MKSIQPVPLMSRLPRSLKPLETWGFGLAGPPGWTGVVPPIHAALASQAIFVWLPVTLVGVLINYQVKRLAMSWVDVAGGTPNYISRLLNRYPILASYAAIGYLLNWVSSISLNAIILTDLVQTNLEVFGITLPTMLVRLGFMLLPFVLALSGTRALSILHLFFILPSIGLLVAFSLQGIGWLALSPNSPGFFPTSWGSFHFTDWAKWYFFATFVTYSSETASSFVADSERPIETVRFLDFAAWTGAIIFIGGSWVVMRLATSTGDGSDVFLSLVTAAGPFWGQSASLIITFLLASSCLLTIAAAVSNCPRILYQLAIDRHLAPVFTVVSEQGVFGPALTLVFGLSMFFLLWGDVSHIVVIGNVGWFVSFTLLHLSFWFQRHRLGVLASRLSLGIFLLEVVILFVGGASWGWDYFLIGLLTPIAILLLDAAIRQIRFAPFHPTWWIQRYQADNLTIRQDLLMFQVTVLIALLSGAVLIGWGFRSLLSSGTAEQCNNLILVLVMIVTFIGVAIACWTILPQVAAIDEARQQAKNLLFTTLDTVPDVVLVLDKNGTIRQTNAATKELFQKNTQEIVGYHLSKFLSALTDTPAQWPIRGEYILKGQQSLRTIESTISQPSNSQFQEYVVILRDITKRKQTEEELKQYRYELEELVDERTTALVEVNEQLQNDISERRRVEEQLRYHTLHDGLTGLPNQVLFIDRLRIAIECVKRRPDYSFAVLFLDLDRFKIVNDSLGHVVGNQLLIAISRRLEAILRPGDTVARFGGDEFTILLEDIQDIDIPTRVAERIQRALALPFKLNEHEVFTSTSIGIVMSSPTYKQPDDILRDADIAMYRAKAKGKSCHEVFDLSMHTRVIGLLHLENELRRALEQQEFQLYYQPIVSLATGKIHAFEALIRWQHPERGLISPLDFIPIAEETGLILPLSNWVLRSACQQMHSWQKQFPEELSLKISVNLSAKQFSQLNLVEQIIQILHETQLNAQSLKLEITESALMENLEVAGLMLSQLRSLGIEIYIDDFGTGYSSLNYIQQFQVDALKIDRSFISRMGIDSNSRQLVQGIFMLARNLGMDVVAEGVETLEQLTQLRTAQPNYGYGQGYLFSKPVDSEHAATLIAGQLQVISQKRVENSPSFLIPVNC